MVYRQSSLFGSMGSFGRLGRPNDRGQNRCVYNRQPSALCADPCLGVDLISCHSPSPFQGHRGGSPNVFRYCPRRISRIVSDRRRRRVGALGKRLLSSCWQWSSQWGPPIQCPLKDDESAFTTDIKHGELAYFRVGKV